MGDAVVTEEKTRCEDEYGASCDDAELAAALREIAILKDGARRMMPLLEAIGWATRHGAATFEYQGRRWHLINKGAA